jgi:predicted TIM-barrel fold metal-dependent hydrolase
LYLSSLPKPAEIPAGTVIWFLSQLMDAVAISAQDEARKLEKGSGRFDQFKPQRPETLIANRVRQTVQRLSDRNPQVLSAVESMNRRVAAALKQASAQSGVPLQMPTDQEQRAFLRSLATFSNPLFSTNPLQQLTPDAVVQGVLKAPLQLVGVFYLACLLTLPRADLTDTLAKLPTRYGSDVRFFAPALVDYSYWLDDFENVSLLDDQVRVMSDIAARKGRPFAVHPYISFCPWRQIVEPRQLDVVKDAIQNKGFIGVKLYPVMGFLPIGNAQADPATYPEKLRKTRPDWAQALDASLTSLYAWCVAEDVPILAHCSESQAPSADAGRRGGPEGWRHVLSMPQFANLRLNLGHLGGLWGLAKPSHNDWTQSLIPLLASDSNLYADVSDYSSIMHRLGTSDANDDKAVSTAVAGFLRQSPAAKNKLMYGTDWVMLSKDMPAEQYYPSMRERLPAAWEVDAAGYFGANAARFLGLSTKKGQAAAKTRLRLEVFYQKHALDKSRLAIWDT